MSKHDPNKKQRLDNFDFSGNGSAMHLVADWQGGPANGIPTIITKATDNISYEQVAKAADVTLQLSMEEFLRRFMGMWCEDAALLAKILGYEVEKDDEWKPFDKRIEDEAAKVTLMKKAFAQGEDTLSNEEKFNLVKMQFALEDLIISASAKEGADQTKDAPQGIDKSKEVNTPMAEAKKEDQEVVMKAADLQEMINKAVAAATAEGKQETQELRKALEAEKEARKAEKEAVHKSEISKAVDKFTLADETKAALKDFMFKARSVEGVDVILKALAEAQEASDAVIEEDLGHGEHVDKSAEADIDPVFAELLKLNQ